MRDKIDGPNPAHIINESEIGGYDHTIDESQNEIQIGGGAPGGVQGGTGIEARRRAAPTGRDRSL
jgi:hypothetical protein